MNRLEKSTLPTSRPIGGISTSLTSEVMIFPNAPPRMIPIAMSRTFPRIANSLNSFSIFLPPSFDQSAGSSGPSEVQDQGSGENRVEIVEFIQYGADDGASGINESKGPERRLVVVEPLEADLQRQPLVHRHGKPVREVSPVVGCMIE